jgi:hypothetical protein
MMEFVSWDDDIPNILWEHKNVPNHQPVTMEIMSFLDIIGNHWYIFFGNHWKSHGKSMENPWVSCLDIYKCWMFRRIFDLKKNGRGPGTLVHAFFVQGP